MTVSLSREQRAMLGERLCEIPEFQDTRARRGLVRDCLAGTQEGEKLIRQLAYEGSAAVFAGDVIDRLADAAALEDGQQPLYLFLAHLDQGGYLNDAARKAFRALRSGPDLAAAGPAPQPAAVAAAPSTLSMTPDRHDRLKALLEALFRGMSAAARKAFVRDVLGRGHAALDDIAEDVWGQTPSVAADAVADALYRHRHLRTLHGDDPITAISRLVRAKKLDGNPDIRPHLEPAASDLSVSEGARPDPGAEVTRNEAVFAPKGQAWNRASFSQRKVLAQRAVVSVRCHQDGGTGFMVSPTLLVTAAHVVVPVRDFLEDVSFYFFHFADANNDFGTSVQVRAAAPDPEYVGNPEGEWDYALIRLKDPPWAGFHPVGLSFEPLTLSPHPPGEETGVFLIHHPSHADLVETDLCPHGPSDGRTIEYWASTTAGSSGAPVFDRDCRVVAIHKGARGGANYGINIRHFCEDLRVNAPALYQEISTGAAGSLATPPDPAMRLLVWQRLADWESLEEEKKGAATLNPQGQD